MKIIGTTANQSWDAEYICTVKHSELEKFLGMYYGDKKLNLNVGDEVDLAKGFNHAQQISDAMQKTRELIRAHQPVVTAILNGLRVETIMREYPPRADAEDDA